MADAAARNKQYDYRANSNLVLTSADRDRRENEPSGEAETLWGKMKGSMGDRASNSQNNKELEEKVAKMKSQSQKRKSTDDPAVKKKHRLLGGGHVLATSFEQTSGGYKPKTRETRLAYQYLLNFVQTYIGDQAQDIIRGAADEVLAILKNDKTRAPDKKKEIEELLGASMTESRFADVSDIGRNITDYSEEAIAESNNETIDDELGVAVVFDDDEEEEENFEVREDSEDEEEEEGEDTKAMDTIDAHDDNGDKMETDDPYTIDPKEIKAFWLKGQVSKNVDSDSIASQKITEEIMTIWRMLASARTDLWSFYITTSSISSNYS